jgi:hypothetical protein
MDSDELRQRLKALGYNNRKAATALGLSADGLAKQLYGARPVSRQTAIIVELLERVERPEIVRGRQQEARYAALRGVLNPVPSGLRDAVETPSEKPPAGHSGELDETKRVRPLGIAEAKPRVLAARRVPATLAERRHRAAAPKFRV